MKTFAKKFNSFSDGIKELAEVSFSAEQALSWESNKLPTEEIEAVKSLAFNAITDRQTENGYDWGCCQLNADSYGVTYRTRGGLTFGWRTVLGASQFDIFENKYVFFVAHPTADDQQAAPADSTLRRSAESFGWKETSTMMLSLSSNGKFL